MLEYLPDIIKGLHSSLTLALAALIVALVLSLLLTVILTLKTPLLTPLVKIYITLFTGTAVSGIDLLNLLWPRPVPINPRISLAVEPAIAAMAMRDDRASIEQRGLYQPTALQRGVGNP